MRLILVLLAGCAGGAAATLLHVPAPWLAGSMMAGLALMGGGVRVEIPDWLRRIAFVLLGICTGAAGSQIEDAHKAGVDTLITGEGPHWSFLRAEELGMNAIYGGHYWTETLGVRALAGHLSERFNLGLECINHPSGI